MGKMQIEQRILLHRCIQEEMEAHPLEALKQIPPIQGHWHTKNMHLESSHLLFPKLRLLLKFLL